MIILKFCLINQLLLIKSGVKRSFLKLLFFKSSQKNMPICLTGTALKIVIPESKVMAIFLKTYKIAVWSRRTNGDRHPFIRLRLTGNHLVFVRSKVKIITLGTLPNKAASRPAFVWLEPKTHPDEMPIVRPSSNDQELALNSPSDPNPTY